MKCSALFIIMGLFLFSCSAAEDKGIIGRMNKSEDRSQAYRNGFLDGCGSGLKSKGDRKHMHFKDLNRYNSEYPLGWDEGFRRCSK